MPGGIYGQRHAVVLLLGTEILIMEQSEIGDISTMVRTACVAARCKPVCSTHVPRANLLSLARATKILATGLLIEAFPVRGTDAARHFAEHFEFNDVADHCDLPQMPQSVPGRHRLRRCLDPAMRNFLREQGKKALRPGQGGGDGLPDHEGPSTAAMRA